MTDEERNLTPARPVAPRRRLAPNTRMAQPIGTPRPAAPPPPTAPPVEALAQTPTAAQPDDEIAQELEGEQAGAQQELMFEARAAAPPAALEPEVAAGTVAAPEPVAPAEPVVAQPAAAPSLTPSRALVAPSPTPSPAVVAAAPPPAQEPDFDFPKTIKDTLRKVDDSWSAFRAAAMRFPSERMDERIAEDAWTRKQMLQHVAAWHDLTADRLIKLINTGQSAPLDRDTDQFNASVARQAIGKTSGEVLKDMDATFNRLRRQLARMSDAQLANDNWWAAWVVGGNTYGHYEEHWTDIYTPELPQGGGRPRR